MTQKDKTIAVVIIFFIIISIYFINKEDIVDFVEDENTTIILNTTPEGEVKKEFKSEFIKKTVEALKTKDDFDPSKIDIDMSEFESIAADELFKKRKIIPYSKEKPPMPDKEENNSTLYGVDVNGNGVRDDLEILAIDQFGYDEELVESVFAGIRTYDYDMYVVENNLLEDDDVMKEVINNIDRMVGCNYIYAGNLDDGENIYNKYGDTLERKKKVKYIARRLSGVADDFVTNEKNCKKFFEDTKKYNFR